MIFKDWRICDISPVGLDLNKDFVYYIHARAWAFKGYLGGTHSWLTLWSKKLCKWIVIENTDAETIHVQGAKVLHSIPTGWCDEGPFISDRDPTQKWFGATPKIVSWHLNTLDIDDLIDACNQYPIKEFKLVTQNCNTFSSFLIVHFNLGLKRPLRSIGFRSKDWWKKNYGIEV
jgi:hypothetical protein